MTDEQIKLLEQFGTDPIIVGITQALFKQYQKGMQEYGKPLSTCGDDDYDWKQMIIEELVDVAKYQQMEIRRLENKLENYRSSYLEPLSEQIKEQQEEIFRLERLLNP